MSALNPVLRTEAGLEKECFEDVSFFGSIAGPVFGDFGCAWYEIFDADRTVNG